MEQRETGSLTNGQPHPFSARHPRRGDKEGTGAREMLQLLLEVSNGPKIAWIRYCSCFFAEEIGFKLGSDQSLCRRFKAQTRENAHRQPKSTTPQEKGTVWPRPWKNWGLVLTVLCSWRFPQPTWQEHPIHALLLHDNAQIQTLMWPPWSLPTWLPHATCFLPPC